MKKANIWHRLVHMKSIEIDIGAKFSLPTNFSYRITRLTEIRGNLLFMRMNCLNCLRVTLTRQHNFVRWMMDATDIRLQHSIQLVNKLIIHNNIRYFSLFAYMLASLLLHRRV